MQHDDSVYLGHMLETAVKAVAKLGNQGRADFDNNEDLRIVLTHWVQIIGEAASRVSPATRDAHPEIPWRAITGMRHRIVHDYMNSTLAISPSPQPSPTRGEGDKGLMLKDLFFYPLMRGLRA